VKTLRQSFAWWCFANRGVPAATLLAEAARLGYAGVDFLDEGLWPVARRVGLQMAAIAGHDTLTDGLNRSENAVRIKAELRVNLAKAVANGIPVLVCFSGNRANLSDTAGMETAAETLGEVAAEAERAGVTLAVELLNSRVDHPDYQGDRTAWGVALCERVGAPSVRLLYDIYHMQIMEGDVMRTIARDHRWFAHYHTAGNPGRGPLDDQQELNYPAIFRAIQRTGLAGFVGHEFIPRGDPVTALAAAHALTVAACA
jgi:hydroxypyruvate isomerase